MVEKPFESENEFNVQSSGLLDEILYRDPPDAVRQAQSLDGVTRVHEIITFADGSKLTIEAQVSSPPPDEMTPAQVLTLKLDGSRRQSSDGGTSEAQYLARQSIAVRLMAQISGMLDHMPERLKVHCPTCEGRKWCYACDGMGCRECKGGGLCQDCGGRGVIAEP